MKLNALGLTDKLLEFREANGLSGFDIGRIITEHKDRFVLLSEDGEYDAELIGNLRFNAESRRDLPAVGDWVAFSPYDEGKGLIHAVYPRYSILERQAVGKSGNVQIIATNIDYGLIVLAVNRDFNINRVERYITLCNAAKVEPIVVLSKVDLVDPAKLQDLMEQLKGRLKDVPVLPISNESGFGIRNLKNEITEGKTYCLLGSSGVGKSTLLNNLMEKEVMQTGAISAAIDRGKHVTSHRELIVLPGGGIIIDNPGMREVGITNSAEGLELTFDSIYSLAENCRFNDCTHTNENGCAILEALAEGEIDEDSYQNYMKMVREQERLEISEHERRRKRKNMSKMIRRVIKNKHGDKA